MTRETAETLRPSRPHDGKASWEVDSHLPKPEGETRIRRSCAATNLVQRPAANINTVHDIMLYAGRMYRDKPGFGMRDIISVSVEERALTRTDSSTSSRPSLRKPVEVYELSEYKWVTYQDALQDIRDLGCGLRTIGAGDRTEGQYFGLYAPTSRHWMFMAQACAFNGVPICTVYDTASVDGVAEAFHEAQVPALYTEATLLPTLSRMLHRTPNLTTVVYNGIAADETLAVFRTQYPQIRLLAIDELRRLGQEHAMPMADRAKRNDIFCLMYTSGGSGKPKGALLTHGNVVAGVSSITYQSADVLAKHDCYLAFMPTAHIIGFVTEMALIFSGVKLAYGRIKTLTDLNVKNCKGDIAEARPTLMIAVPTVWELFRKAIKGKVKDSGGLKKVMFHAALKTKNKAEQHSIPGVAKMTDLVVFNRVRQVTGGRLRTILNAGNQISPKSQQFLSVALVQMLQAYGMTEAAGAICVQHPSFRSFGSVGGPSPQAEIKLVDRPEVNPTYLSTNHPPRGEVHVRGPSIFKGYLNKDLDKHAFTEDRWLRSGDIGQWNDDGTLTVIDRVKNHVPVAGGHIVTLERLEATYKACTLVTNVCMVANPFHSGPALVAIVHPTNVPSFARKHGIPCGPTDLENLCYHGRLVDLVLDELNSVGRRQGLSGHQLLEAVVLTADEWTAESGVLTAAQKLRRHIVDEYYEDELNAVYTANGPAYYENMTGIAADLIAVANRPVNYDGRTTPTPKRSRPSVPAVPISISRGTTASRRTNVIDVDYMENFDISDDEETIQAHSPDRLRSSTAPKSTPSTLSRRASKIRPRCASLASQPILPPPTPTLS